MKVRVDADKALAGLRMLEDDLKVRAVRAMLRRPGSAVARAMKSTAPRRSGMLAESITSQLLSETAGERLDLFTGASGRGSFSTEGAAVLIGPNRKVRGRSRAYIGVVLEGGAGPHVIRARARNKSKFLSFGFNQGAEPGVQHPGVRPRRFMERALEQVSGQIEQLAIEGLAAYLDRTGRA